MKAINGLPREDLASHPELLAAVRAGFATEGGQQLAVTINMLDADIIGNLNHSSRAALLDWTTGLMPDTIAQIGFDIDPALSAARASVLQWIADTRNGVQSDSLQALPEGSQIRIKIDPDQSQAVLVDAAARTISVKKDLAPGELPALHAALDEMAAAAASPELPMVPADGASLLEQTLEFDDSIALETRQILLAAADNSPTLRNVLLRAMKLFGKITVSVAGDQHSAGRLDLLRGKASIFVKFGSPEQMAATIAFELGNAAQLPSILAAGHSPSDTLNTAQIDEYSARIYQGFIKKSPIERYRFLAWARQQRSGITDAELAADGELINKYLHSTYGADAVRHATRTALAVDVQELDTALLLEKIGVELEGTAAEGGLAGASSSSLTGTAISAIRRYRLELDQWAATGNLRQAGLAVQIESGHTGAYFHSQLTGTAPSFAAITADPALDPDPLIEGDADAAVDAALTDAGTAAGTATQDAARDALNRHGPGNPGAIEDAAHASAQEQSNALAAKLLDHPEIAGFFRSLGKTLTGAARVAIVYT
nr:hypothetical protein [Methylibium sp.]